jgi:hypothetical protein
MPWRSMAAFSPADWCPLHGEQLSPSCSPLLTAICHQQYQANVGLSPLDTPKPPFRSRPVPAGNLPGNFAPMAVVPRPRGASPKADVRPSVEVAAQMSAAGGLRSVRFWGVESEIDHSSGGLVWREAERKFRRSPCESRRWGNGPLNKFRGSGPQHMHELIFLLRGRRCWRRPGG